jgi:hypothetical protein
VARSWILEQVLRAVSQLLWRDKDHEVWFSLRENHQKAYRFPDFLRRSTGREQRCATFFEESRMQFGRSNKIYRKSGFGLNQLRNCCRQDNDLRLRLQQQNAQGVAFLDGKATWKAAGPACSYRGFARVVHQPPGAATPGGEVSCSGF